MSRSGYRDDCDDQWGLWRGAVASAIRGKRGQAFIREMVEALDALPEKKLIVGELRQGGEVCALGSVGVRRGLNLETIDPEDPEAVAGAFGIATPLAQEIMWMNDDAYWSADPEKRWSVMRKWASDNLKEPRTGP